MQLFHFYNKECLLRGFYHVSITHDKYHHLYNNIFLNHDVLHIIFLLHNKHHPRSKIYPIHLLLLLRNFHHQAIKECHKLLTHFSDHIHLAIQVRILLPSLLLIQEIILMLLNHYNFIPTLIIILSHKVLHVIPILLPNFFYIGSILLWKSFHPYLYLYLET